MTTEVTRRITKMPVISWRVHPSSGDSGAASRSAIVTVLAPSQVSTNTLASISCFFTWVARSIGIFTSPFSSVWAETAFVEFTIKLTVDPGGAFLT